MKPKDEFNEGIQNGWRKDGIFQGNFIYAWDGGEVNFPEKENVDYATFFLRCPEYRDSVEDEDSFYEIKWNETIETSSGDCKILSIFLIARYVSLISEIIRCGLKKDYVIREENLKSKG